MYNLKYKNYLIDHLIASVFITSQKGLNGNKRSSIKFGSYDNQAIQENLQMMRTKDKSTWAVQLTGASMIGADLTLQHSTTYIIYDPQFPYLYLPERDFMTYLQKTSNFYAGKNINCNFAHRGSCYFNDACNDVISGDYVKHNIELSIGDAFQGRAYTISVPFEKLLVRGDHIGESYKYCYIGVFKSAQIEKDTWHMGNAIMDDYYAVFDLTPADERNENYIQFGIAKKVEGHEFEY